MTLQLDVHRDGFTPANALQLVKQYDVVVDASDNAPTRYLISDACCVLRNRVSRLMMHAMALRKCAMTSCGLGKS